MAVYTERSNVSILDSAVDPEGDPLTITEINGQPLATYYSWYALTFALSLTGSPVISIPFGRDQLGMPFGIQLVMTRNKDLSLLALANLLEEELSLSSRN